MTPLSQQPAPAHKRGVPVKRILSILLPVLLLCGLTLARCSFSIRAHSSMPEGVVDDVSDETLEQFLAAMESGDTESFRALLHPSALSDPTLDERFESAARMYNARRPLERPGGRGGLFPRLQAPAQPNWQLNIRDVGRPASDPAAIQVTSFYRLSPGGGDLFLSFDHIDDARGHGIADFRFSDAERANDSPDAMFDDLDRHFFDPVSEGVFFFHGSSTHTGYAFFSIPTIFLSLFCVIHVLFKIPSGQPPKKILLILLCLTQVGFSYAIRGQDLLRFLYLRVFLFDFTPFLYEPRVAFIAPIFPVGPIVYWLIRKRVRGEVTARSPRPPEIPAYDEFPPDSARHRSPNEWENP